MPQTIDDVRIPEQDLLTEPFPPVVPEPEELDDQPVWKSRWFWVAASLLVLVTALTGWQTFGKAGAPKYVTANVQRGSVSRTINATGKLQAVQTVDVGTQVSGTVSDIFVDFNSPVKKGQIIAQLDQSQLQAQLTQARANLMSAQMGVQTSKAAFAGAQSAVESADANVARMQSMVNDAQTNFDRNQQLYNEKVAARKDVETAKATLDQALAQKQQAVAQVNQSKSQTESARLQITQAQAQVTQAQAQVDIAAVNLDHAIIRAPIDGVIVARNVNPGQTVAASLNTPTLFSIANDLKQMQVLADIDEADVGQLTNDSKVTFTVDAFPSETFSGRISQIRLAPQTVQNVVTYTAVIDVANPDGKLRPGMTANVIATVAERNNVLTVPNAALRFRPANEGGQGQTQARPAATQKHAGGGTVYRVTSEGLERVKVQLGVTNGSVSEVTGGDLQEGDVLAVAAESAGQKRVPATGSSPFGMPRGGRR